MELCGGPGYLLLTTSRGRAQSPRVVDAAAVVVEVPAGRIDELAGDLLATVASDRLVALGGGRVIDTAKALAAALGDGVRAMAIPTTMSGAEMTSGHRRARGASADARGSRPTVVINDPVLSAS